MHNSMCGAGSVNIQKSEVLPSIDSMSSLTLSWKARRIH